MPTRVVLARRALAVVAWLLVVGVVVQIFLAGRGVFVGPSEWARHRAFVHAFEWLSPVAVLLAYLGRGSRGTKWLAWLTVVLLFLQYATAGTTSSLGHLGLAAIHPVSAALLLWTAIELGRRVGRDQRTDDASPTVKTRPAAG